ncbi:MAG: 50S ribosomal protein L9 [Saprospiraceae bacterium]|nr:50S ribosomal protein L9 [Saprospiraceae bacterium]
MEIILLKEIDKLGDKHEVVNVKPGYARNYLIPQGFALIANSSNRKRLDELKRIETAREAKLKDHYQEIADKLKDIVLKVGAKAGTSGKIFGSVTNVQIAQLLKEEHGVEIERRKIVLVDEVKELGNYKAKLNLHPEVISEVAFEVIQE